MYKANVFRQLGASNHTSRDRERNDFYATEPKATELLIEKCKEVGEPISEKVLEPCAGNGHISEILKEHGHEVVSKDIVERDYPLEGKWDFLLQNEKWHGGELTTT